MDFTDFDEKWKLIEDGMKETINIARSGTEKLPQNLYMKLHGLIYNIICSKFESQVYKRYGLVIDDYLINQVFPSIQQQKGIALLKNLVQEWKIQKIIIKLLGGLFSHLDRYYAPSMQLMTTKDMCWNSFRILMISGSNGMFVEKITDTVLKIVEDYRHNLSSTNDNQIPELEALKETVEMLVEIAKGKTDLYERVIEEQLNRVSISYYTQCRQQLKERFKDDSNNLTTKGEEVLKSERFLAKYFHPNTESVLLRECKTCLDLAFCNKAI